MDGWMEGWMDPGINLSSTQSVYAAHNGTEPGHLASFLCPSHMLPLEPKIRGPELDGSKKEIHFQVGWVTTGPGLPRQLSQFLPVSQH